MLHCFPFLLLLLTIIMHSGMAQTEWGTKNYTQYIRGTLTIVLSAPHGGDLDDPSIPLRDCSGCTTVTDSYTIQLTNEIADEIYAQSGASPHVIISHLLRKKLDPNREVGEAANGNELAEEVYYDFHGFIEKAKEYVTSECGGGILFDIHGQSHAEQWIELGYLLTSPSLQPQIRKSANMLPNLQFVISPVNLGFHLLKF